MSARRLWNGRSIFSRATENGPAFYEYWCVQTSTQRSAGPLRTLTAAVQVGREKAVCERQVMKRNQRDAQHCLIYLHVISLVVPHHQPAVGPLGRNQKTITLSPPPARHLFGSVCSDSRASRAGNAWWPTTPTETELIPDGPGESGGAVSGADGTGHASLPTEPSITHTPHTHAHTLSLISKHFSTTRPRRYHKAAELQKAAEASSQPTPSRARFGEHATKEMISFVQSTCVSSLWSIWFCVRRGR